MSVGIMFFQASSVVFEGTWDDSVPLQRAGSRSTGLVGQSRVVPVCLAVSGHRERPLTTLGVWEGPSCHQQEELS